MYVGSNNTKRVARLKELFGKKRDLETDLGAEVEINGERTWTSISAVLEADPRNRDDWPRQHEWLRVTGEKFAKVFPKYL